jgi:AcrR family transcriptional regulator
VQEWISICVQLIDKCGWRAARMMEFGMNDQTEWYRIGQLEQLSGVPRRTIHFYVEQGLLHRPRKTGKTMAYYDNRHLRRLEFIKTSKRSGLPLIAIKENLSELESSDPAAFDADQPLTSLPAGYSFPRKNGKRKTAGKKTRERILDAGSSLFRKKGYKETRITDITKELNVGKGTFYFYFPDKKALLFECVPRIFVDLFSQGWDRIRAVEDPLKRLELRAEIVIPVLKEFCAIIQLSKEAMEDDDPKLQRLGRKTYLSICRPIESDIKRGVELGRFAPINPKIAAVFMIGIMEQFYYLQTVDPDYHPSLVWGDIQRLLVDGIRGVVHAGS